MLQQTWSGLCYWNLCKSTSSGELEPLQISPASHFSRVSRVIKILKNITSPHHSSKQISMCRAQHHTTVYREPETWFTWKRRIESHQEREGDLDFSSARVQSVSTYVNYNGSVSSQTDTPSHTLHKQKAFLALAIPVRPYDYCVLRGSPRISATCFMLFPKTWPFFLLPGSSLTSPHHLVACCSRASFFLGGYSSVCSPFRNRVRLRLACQPVKCVCGGIPLQSKVECKLLW